MACASGYYHTVTLSNDGIVHSFGRNSEGQLGIGHNMNLSLPTQIIQIPTIKQVSCGDYFTVLIDYEGFMWSFGNNQYGQLGTGNTTKYNIPQKIQEIPPVRSISCGGSHLLIITKDSNLWSCGYNLQGQLCLENKENQFKPKQTSFTNISKIAAGGYHSIFQNIKGELFGCGHNKYGEIGLGHFNHPQVTVSLIPNQPLDIIQFFCGYRQSFLLDSQGNVFSVGYNHHGQLGLGHNNNHHIFTKIPNIPRIQHISGALYSFYLLDFEGNVWSFGYNDKGQLGHGDNTNRNTPMKIQYLNDIQQTSFGTCGYHFFVKDSQNKIFVMGRSTEGQLGTGNTNSLSIPKVLNSDYFSIWGNQNLTNLWSFMSLETTMNWKDHEIIKLELLQSKINQVKYNLGSNNCKIKQEFPNNSFESWNEVQGFLDEKFQQINEKLNQKQDIKLQIQKDVQIYENELKEIENQIEKLQERKKQIEENLLPKAKQSQNSIEIFNEIEKNQKVLCEMCYDVSVFCENEKELNQELSCLFKEKTFEEFDCDDVSKLLWKMDLVKYQSLFEINQLNGLAVSAMDDIWFWKQLGLEKKDCLLVLYYFKMMKTSGYSKTFSPNYEADCCVCSHNSPEKTIHLLKEYEIPIDDDFILKNNYTAPILISKVLLEDLLGKDIFSQKGIQIILKLDKWKKIHKLHLKDLNIN